MSATIHALYSREVKSRVIVDWLRANRPDVTAEIAERMEPYGRSAVAELAGMRADPPHRWKAVSPQTWELVVARLRHPVHISRQPEDPFDGIEGY